MLRYHVAFYLPQAPSHVVVAEALDFPGAATQGFDLTDARLMIASALASAQHVMRPVVWGGWCYLLRATPSRLQQPGKLD